MVDKLAANILETWDAFLAWLGPAIELALDTSIGSPLFVLCILAMFATATYYILKK